MHVPRYCFDTNAQHVHERNMGASMNRKTPAGRGVRLKVRQLETYMKLAGVTTNAALAKRMGTVSETTVGRIRKGENFSLDVVVGLLRAFEGTLSFDDLFELQDDEDETQAGAA